MRVHLVNPSHVSFGVGVITPRWLYVIAAATPPEFGDPVIVDETLNPIDVSTIRAGDVVGVGIHTGNALRGYEVGNAARAAGATVIYGGIHATLYPDEALDIGGANAVVGGRRRCASGRMSCAPVMPGTLQRRLRGRTHRGTEFLRARWDLMPDNSYMWASVQTLRGCPKHCSFCSVWRTDGQKPRPRATDAVIEEIVELRKRGFRFIALADDNFYPVPLGRSEDGGPACGPDDPQQPHRDSQ